VSSGTCKFPSNFFGCDNEAVAGKVKYIADDIDLACQVPDSSVHYAKRAVAGRQVGVLPRESGHDEA